MKALRTKLVIYNFYLIDIHPISLLYNELNEVKPILSTLKISIFPPRSRDEVKRKNLEKIEFFIEK